MARYRYSESDFRLIENSCLAFGVYQFLDRRVVTVALSEGLLELFGLPDRAEAYALMDNDMYRDVHPDDVARIEDAALRFATEGGSYDVTYRTKIRDEYHVIHAHGKHTYPDAGVRLAVVSYADEGVFSEDHRGSFDRALQNEFEKTLNNLKGHFDPMTGLPGLNYFFELAETDRRGMLERGEQPVALYFDFTGMKGFNLRYGFAEGDKLILAMSRVLIRAFSVENCCRIGGDRFAAYDKAEGLENKLNKVIAECRTINEGKNLPVRIGIYQIRAQDVGIGVACDRAKMACDRNRASYSSGYSYFSDEMLKETELHRYIIENLDRAIRENWIQVYYQPIIRAANGRVCDDEALARWIDPEKGFLSPGEFIPILEDAGLIYKLDLFVTEQVLSKMKKTKELGQYVVPSSVNISRSDFESCDIVEEIRKRVDEAGIDRSMLTIEITESVVGNDLTYIREQVERFHDLGFKVWMDDYGSGYSSPDILQTIPFDTIKLDMQFIRQYEKNKTSGIIISGLVKMAISLGIETVVEGVETEAQVEFLKEIGCTKLQGFYYSKPIPMSDLLKRYEEGAQIGFENPAETEYYATIGKVNLYDISLAVNEDQALQNYFNTMPMAILELGEKEFAITRSNQSYRRYMKEHLGIEDVNVTAQISEMESGPAASLMKKTIQCAREGRQVLTDEVTADGNISHLLIRRVAVNPVQKRAALIVIVLGMTDGRLADSLTYAHVAQALSADYIDLYYVNLDNEHYIEYLPDADSGEMAVERRGKDFFATVLADAEKSVYESDIEMYVSSFTREYVTKSIAEHGAFTLTYRCITEGKPVYVQLKAIRIGTEGNRIIIGINNVDVQMKHKEALERIREERLTYSRLNALIGDYYLFYTVDPETGSYYEYHSSQRAESLGASPKGEDFFADTLAINEHVIYPDDREYFREHFSRQAILNKVMNNEIFMMTYRLLFGDEPRYVNLRIAMVTEDGTRQLIVGLNDVDVQIRREQEYIHNLSAARDRANIDAQTGVKNRRAFVYMEQQMDQLIEKHSAPAFSIVAFDIDLSGMTGLSDQEKSTLITEQCMKICRIYRHSPVYRLSETGFAVISRGEDYTKIDHLMEKLAEENKKLHAAGLPAIHSGMARYQSERSTEDLYLKAKENMEILHQNVMKTRETDS